MGRIDGRAADALRPVAIMRRYLKRVPGSVLVQFGDTHVLVTAIAEEKVPPFRSDGVSGWVTAEYAMLPGSTSTRKDRRTGGREKEIQRLIGRSLRAIVDFTALGPRTITVDCDVIQADGGTRTAAITGAYVALADCVADLKTRGLVAPEAGVLRDRVAAVSVGLVDGVAVLDLCYAEDSAADVDFNVVMTGSHKFVEVQGTAESDPFSADQLQELLRLGQHGITELLAHQQRALVQA